MTGAPKHPIVIGHRGAPGYRPEHTASGYELAFEMGADAVEPDIVATRDGVLVLRHENEIGATTDVADHPELADRRTTKEIDGQTLTGWFTEDFTWPELQTLTLRERIPELRASSARFDGTEGILRLRDLLAIVERASERRRRELGIVVEIKHPTYFAGLGLPLDELLAAELEHTGYAGDRLVIESFEQSVLTRLRQRGLDARYVYLIEKAGAPADLVASMGSDAPDYAAAMTDAGLDALVGGVDGISVDKSLLMGVDEGGEALGASDLVERAHTRGLDVYTWTLRPENVFLAKSFRRGDDRGAFGDWRGEFGLILDTGVDGIFVDHTDLGIAVRDAASS
ncbi:glycerophosphodiester phosphodiesterase [Okibacterium endophyticum]